MPFPIKMSLTLETFLVTLLFIYAFSFYLLYFLSRLQCSVPKLHPSPEVLASAVRQETSRQPPNRERDQGGEAAPQTQLLQTALVAAGQRFPNSKGTAHKKNPGCAVIIKPLSLLSPEAT